MKKRGVGAPKGGRVHWLLHSLPFAFKASYILSYDYSRHNYVFYRMHGRRLFDVFIVHQTSKHYWRMSYCCLFTQYYEFFGYHKTLVLAEKMCELWRENTFE